MYTLLKYHREQRAPKIILMKSSEVDQNRNSALIHCVTFTSRNFRHLSEMLALTSRHSLPPPAKQSQPYPARPAAEGQTEVPLSPKTSSGAWGGRQGWDNHTGLLPHRAPLPDLQNSSLPWSPPKFQHMQQPTIKPPAV